MAAKLYTQAELEETIRRRLSDQDDLIGKVAERAAQKLAIQIRPEFEHVNRRLDDLTEQVRQTNGQVRNHSGLFQDLGVVELSQDERQALPEVLVEHMRTKENRRLLDRVERRRVVRQQFLTTFISTAAAVVVAMGVLVGLLRAAGIIH